MNDLEFTVIVTRIVWDETKAEPTPQETIKRLKTLVEERTLGLNALKDVSEALLSSTCWAEQNDRLAKALLWGLYALYEQQALTFKSALSHTSSASPTP